MNKTPANIADGSLKPGNKLLCVAGIDEYIKGKIYTFDKYVEAVTTGDPFGQIGTKELFYAIFSWRFIRFEESTKLAKPAGRFELGDKVLCIKEQRVQGLFNYQIYTVVEIGSSGDWSESNKAKLIGVINPYGVESFGFHWRFKLCSKATESNQELLDHWSKGNHGFIATPKASKAPIIPKTYKHEKSAKTLALAITKMNRPSNGQPFTFLPQLEE